MTVWTAPLGLDLLVRGACMASLGLVSALVWRSHPAAVASRMGAMLALGLCVYLFNTSPADAGLGLPEPWRAVLSSCSYGNVVLFWLFCRALFVDSARWHLGHLCAWWAMVALKALGCTGALAAGGAASLALGLAPILFAVLALREAWSGWRDDLVESRRPVRAWIVWAGSAFTLSETVGSIWLPQATAPASTTLFVAMLCCIVVVVAWRLLESPSKELFFPPERDCTPLAGEPDRDPVPVLSAPAPTPMPEPVLMSTSAPQPQPQTAEEPPPGALPSSTFAPSAPAATAPTPGDGADLPDPPETALAEALNRLMTEAQIYREPSLTIGALALRLGVQEYRLRRLINQQLGERNFNTYLNRYRIRDAQRALADPAQRSQTILGIALEVGFQSIGPFNRAFKAQTGLTPTDHRKQSAN